MNFRIRDLRNFFETASCRTMYEAAKKLGISQPSLSESVKRLEQDLKMIVFYRSRSGVQLTPSGRTLYEKTQDVFTSLDNIESDCVSVNEFQQNTIVVGCHPMVSAYILPKILEEFDKQATGFRLEIIHDTSYKIQFHMQSGLIDFAFIVNPFPAPDLIMKKCLLDEIGVWRSRTKECADRVICDPSSFHNQAILKKWKKRPRNILVSDNLDLNVRLTDSGIGLGIIPKRGIEMLGADLEQVPNTPISSVEVFLVHKPVFGRNKTERLFIDVTKKILATFN